MITLPRIGHAALGPPRPSGRRGGRGFTLAELVLSMVIMSILMMGISSAIVIAAKAVPAAASVTAQQRECAAALDRLAADLACATAIKELTATAIAFQVADRGHDAAGDESIRYAWSGTAGGSLTREYNTNAPTTVASNVGSFALTWESIAGTLTSPPRVLMVVNNTGSLTTDDNARVAKLTAWAFPVTLISSSATQAQFDAAYALCDVLYLQDDATSFTLYSRIGNPSVGIVCEQDTLYGAVGISSFSTIDSNDKIAISDNTHVITSGFSNGNLQIASPNIDLHIASGTVAPGLRQLASAQGSSGSIELGVLECNGILSNGSAARGRRVVLPWGGSLFNQFAFSDLNSDARTILKRSLVWAAAPPVYDAVRIKITVGSAQAMETRVELLNQPGVPRP